MLKIKYKVYTNDINNPNDFMGYVVEDKNKNLSLILKDSKEELDGRFSLEVKSILLSSNIVLEILTNQNQQHNLSVNSDLDNTLMKKVPPSNYGKKPIYLNIHRYLITSMIF